MNSTVIWLNKNGIRMEITNIFEDLPASVVPVILS
jgi:hypothetical protein